MTIPFQLIGQAISRNHMVEKLDGGGVGPVYKAEGVVALKFLPGHRPAETPLEHQGSEPNSAVLGRNSGSWMFYRCPAAGQLFGSTTKPETGADHCIIPNAQEHFENLRVKLAP